MQSTNPNLIQVTKKICSDVIPNHTIDFVLWFHSLRIVFIIKQRNDTIIIIGI